VSLSKPIDAVIYCLVRPLGFSFTSLPRYGKGGQSKGLWQFGHEPIQVISIQKRGIPALSPEWI